LAQLERVGCCLATPADFLALLALAVGLVSIALLLLALSLCLLQPLKALGDFLGRVAA